MKPNVSAADGPSAITPSLWWVGRSAWGGLPPLTPSFDGNIFLLKGDRYDVLIDAGGGPSIKDLQHNIRLAGSTPERIREIWITHCHCDHFLGAGPWAAKYPRTICCLSKVGLTLLRRKDYRLTGLYLGPGALKLPKKLQPLEDGSVLRCPPFELRVEATPGHVPDGLCFRGQVDGLELLVTGDTVIGDQHIPGTGLQKGMIGWICGSWMSNMRSYRQSLARLAATRPDLLLPGHGLPQAGPAARSSLKNALRRVERLMAFPDFLNLGPYYSFSAFAPK